MDPEKYSPWIVDLISRMLPQARGVPRVGIRLHGCGFCIALFGVLTYFHKLAIDVYSGHVPVGARRPETANGLARSKGGPKGKAD